MSRLSFKATWHALKGRAVQHCARLLGHDKMLQRGRDEEMLGRMQARLSQTKRVPKKIPRSCFSA